MGIQLSAKQWVLSQLILALLLGLALLQFFQVITARASISFLDVGQGDAILIQTEEYKNILIDASPDGAVVEKLSEQLGFFNQEIDLFILTHPDLDHYGGILDVLQKYPVKKVMLTGIASKSGLYLAFLDELKAQNIPIIYPSSNQDLRVGHNLYLDLLYPFGNQSLIGQEVKSKNDTSISLILRNTEGKALALLTGDAEAKQEIDLLLSAQDLTAPIFKLGHHGSKTSNQAAFLAAVEPDTVVVSAGKDNKFGHPHEEVMERVVDTEIKSTADEGSIQFMLK